MAGSISRLSRPLRLGLAIVTGAMLTASLLVSTPAQAASQSFIVNSTADPGDGACTVGDCTLREAITAANGTVDADLISFKIPGGGVHVIQPVTVGFPVITQPVSIDGRTQPGSRPNTAATRDNAVWNVRIDASLLVDGSNGLTVTKGPTTIRGLEITGVPVDDDGDGGRGIAFLNSAANTGNAVKGNFIHGNEREGVFASDLASLLTIGGTSRADRNVLTENRDGIELDSPQDTVQGNFIGVGLDGRSDAGNLSIGVRLVHSNSAEIGGTASGAGNVISANSFGGVQVVGATANAFLQGNLIGTTADGEGSLGNGGAGIVTLASGAEPFAISVGGDEPGTGNVIAHNDGPGVRIVAGDGISVEGNSIFDNAGLGIDLAGDGAVQPNDPGDGDGGPNTLQNFPVLNHATATKTSLVVRGTLNSTPGEELLVELFASDSCDLSGNGEGAAPVGFFSATPDSHGFVFFKALFAERPAGERLTATATNDGRTSEFSACRSILPLASISDVSLEEGDAGTTRAVFHVVLSQPSSRLVTVDFATADGTAHSPGDYRGRTGTRVFEPGVRSLPVSILVAGDKAHEPNETFFVKLLDPVGTQVADGSGKGTIRNDDLKLS
jgi:CSLREA domain-containing protein